MTRILHYIHPLLLSIILAVTTTIIKKMIITPIINISKMCKIWNTPNQVHSQVVKRWVNLPVQLNSSHNVMHFLHHTVCYCLLRWFHTHSLTTNRLSSKFWHYHHLPHHSRSSHCCVVLSRRVTRTISLFCCKMYTNYHSHVHSCTRVANHHSHKLAY